MSEYALRLNAAAEDVRTALSDVPPTDVADWYQSLGVLRVLLASLSEATEHIAEQVEDAAGDDDRFFRTTGHDDANAMLLAVAADLQEARDAVTASAAWTDRAFSRVAQVGEGEGLGAVGSTGIDEDED
ncbi:MAG: hypothetical protein K0U64_12535 [Actinomycetia bacterium]|nr:hypothetical protein [Actinomycetes bacterium]